MREIISIPNRRRVVINYVPGLARLSIYKDILDLDYTLIRIPILLLHQLTFEHSQKTSSTKPEHIFDIDTQCEVHKFSLLTAVGGMRISLASNFVNDYDIT